VEIDKQTRKLASKIADLVEAEAPHSIIGIRACFTAASGCLCIVDGVPRRYSSDEFVAMLREVIEERDRVLGERDRVLRPWLESNLADPADPVNHKLDCAFVKAPGMPSVKICDCGLVKGGRDDA
jgi:hypothetical protein